MRSAARAALMLVAALSAPACGGDAAAKKGAATAIDPAEQARIVRLLVERVDVAQDHISVRLRAEGLQTLVEQLRTTDAKAHAA